MNLMNCVKGLKVRIISKSVGGTLDCLGYRETKVGKISDDREEYDGEIIIDTIGNYFLPHDLTPLWEEGEQHS